MRNRHVTASVISMLTLSLLVGCGSSSTTHPVAQKPSTQGSSTTNEVNNSEPVELFDPTENLKIQPQGLLDNVDVSKVKSIKVFPESIVLSSAGKPTLFVNGYDEDGKLLGSINVSDLNIKQEAGQNLGISKPTLKTFKVDVPGTIRSNTFGIELKNNADIHAKMSIDVATVKPNVKVISDTKLVLPMPGVDPDALTLAQVQSATLPFSTDDIATILKSRSVDNIVYPLIISGANLKVGDIIFIPNYGTIFGRVKSVKNAPIKQLITLELIKPEDAFEKYDFNTMKSSAINYSIPIKFAQPPQAGQITTLDEDPQRCKGAIPSGLVFKPVAELNLTRSPENHFIAEGIAKLIFNVPLGIAGVTIDCTTLSTKTFAREALGPFLTGETSSDIRFLGTFSAQAYAANGEAGYKINTDLSTAQDLSPDDHWFAHFAAIAKDTSQGTDGIPLSTDITASVTPRIYEDIKPGNLLTNRFFDKLKEYLTPEFQKDLVKVRLYMGPQVSAETHLYNSSWAYQNATGSNAKISGGLAFGAELAGKLADILYGFGMPLLAGDGSISKPLLKSETPKMEGKPELTMDDGKGNANVKLNWEEDTDVSKIILGDKTKFMETKNLDPSGGLVVYKPDGCNPAIKNDMLGYGPVKLKLGDNKITIFDNMPFYVDSEGEKDVEVCAVPKLEATGPDTLSAEVGEIAQGKITVINAGKPNTNLNYNITIPDANMTTSKTTGSLKGGQTDNIDLSLICNAERDETINILVSADLGLPSVTLPVKITCKDTTYKIAVGRFQAENDCWSFFADCRNITYAYDGTILGKNNGVSAGNNYLVSIKLDDAAVYWFRKNPYYEPLLADRKYNGIADCNDTTIPGNFTNNCKFYITFKKSDLNHYGLNYNP